jgi:3-oxoacyl-[acyl-carrier protein] reductase
MFTSITGRSVIVTGASKGIGKGIARVFAKAGGKVLVVARDLAAAQKTADEIKAAGGTAAAHAADVRNWDDMERMAAAAEKAHGGVDILCANAGIFPAAKLTEMTAEKWTKGWRPTKQHFPFGEGLPARDEKKGGPHHRHLHHRPGDRHPG